jgi:hypothetical protein
MFHRELIIPAMAVLMTSCGGNPLRPQPSHTTVNAARDQLKALVLDPKQAFLGRAEYVIDNSTLLEPALDRAMQNLEFWLNRDPHLLRQQLATQANIVRDEILLSDTGLASLQQLALARFASPAIRRELVPIPGATASTFERKLGEIAGVVLSGRPAPPREIPPATFVQIDADYGLLPAPLERNSRAKGYSSPLRYRENHGGWLGDSNSPALPVIARSVRDLVRRHPDASRLNLVYLVLRRMDQPIEWRLHAEPSSDGAAVILQGEGQSSGFRQRIGPFKWNVATLHLLAEQSPLSAP